MSGKMTVSMECYGILDKTVAPLNASAGRIYVPVEWVGKKVRVVLMEDSEI